MRKIVFLVLALWGLAAADAAPLPRIKGKIVEAGSNNPVDMADVFLLAEGSSAPVAHALPGEDGSFAFAEDVRDGTYTLMVRLVGYDVYTKGIVLNGPGQVNLGNIALEALEIGIANVEVVARKKQVIYKLDKKVVEASASLLASGGTAVDILENTPSVRVDAEGEVTFRGSSGFTVYVDGKPSLYSGSQALQQIPSSRIENIEIITTPSARHDTGGDVGIINIITKKDGQQGFNGIVNTTGSTTGTRSVDFLLSRQAGRSRWSFGGDWTDRLLKSHFDQDKTTVVDGLETRSHSNGPRESNNFNYSLKGGWQYNFPNTTLTADLEGGYSGRYRTGDLDYSEAHSLGATEDKLYFSRDYYYIDQTFLLASAGLDHRFDSKGHRLSALFYYKHGADALEYFQSDLFDGNVDKRLLSDSRDVFREAEANYRATKKKNLPSHFIPSNTYENGHRQMGHHAYEDEIKPTMRINVDYVLPFRHDGRMETGYQYFSYFEDGTYGMEFWNPASGAFEFRNDNAIYDNYFYFQNGIHSIYAIYAGSRKAFSYQAGLRGEHTHRVLHTDVPGANRAYNNFHLFPSVHLGYALPREHQLMASYSRRITRPSLFYMEPYITYRDFYSAEIGNPDIQNEFINSFEMNYKKNISTNTVSATLFHRSRANKIERLRIPYESAIRAGVTLDSMANVGNDYSSGLELNVQAQPLRVWSITLNGSFYHYRVVNKLLRSNKDETSTNYDVTLNNGFDLGKLTRIQLDGNFVGPSVATQGRTHAYWYVNLAVRRQFFNRRLNTTLAMRDAFNSARYVSVINAPGLQSTTRIRPTYPLLTLTLSYTFNNFKPKQASPKDDRDLFEGTNH